MSFGEIVFAMVISGIVGLRIYAYIVSDIGDIRRILWDNTMLGWGWRKLFGEKKKVKQAPPHFTMGSNSMYINHPLPQPTAFNTSSNFTFPIQTGRPIGKPLVIQNWDRLAGMMIPILTNPNFNGHNWIVVNAGQTTEGYECMFENSVVRKAVILTVYSDIYDSHRVMVKCGGRMSIMDIETFKDPNNMLYRIANEFQEKFR